MVHQSREIIQQKNADEVLQQFIYHTSSQQFRDRAVKNTKDAAPDSGALPGKDDATRDGQQAVQHLRTLAQLLLTNSEARKLLQDFTLIGRDMFARGASNLAERARPDAERMAKVDDAAASPVAGVCISLPSVNHLLIICRVMAPFLLLKAELIFRRMDSVAL